MNSSSSTGDVFLTQSGTAKSVMTKQAAVFKIGPLDSLYTFYRLLKLLKIWNIHKLREMTRASTVQEFRKERERVVILMKASLKTELLTLHLCSLWIIKFASYPSNWFHGELPALLTLVHFSTFCKLLQEVAVVLGNLPYYLRSLFFSPPALLHEHYFLPNLKLGWRSKCWIWYRSRRASVEHLVNSKQWVCRGCWAK